MPDNDPPALKIDTPPLELIFGEQEVLALAEAIAARLPTETISDRLLQTPSFQRAVAGAFLRVLKDKEIGARVAEAFWTRIKELE